MSTFQAVLAAPKATLAGVVALINAHETLTPVQRTEMLSAINTAAKVFGRPPHMISTEAAALRSLINAALPTAHRLQPRRWRNVTSLLRRSVALVNPSIIPVRSRGVLLVEWEDLLSRVVDKQLGRGLARFSKHCSARDIRPADVDQQVYNDFYTALDADGLMRSPRETHQTAGHAWNKAVSLVPGWPALTLNIHDFRRNRSLEWDAYPDSFRCDVEAFLTQRSDDDPFDLENDAPVLGVAARFVQNCTLSCPRAEFRPSTDSEWPD